MKKQMKLLFMYTWIRVDMRNIYQNFNQIYLYCIREAAKKCSSPNGQAIKSGGGRGRGSSIFPDFDAPKICCRSR